MSKRALVLGAGLQGACAAFALVERGWSVVVVDQAERPLDRASRRNEGKIHLGMTYANDASFATPRLMLESGLAFGPLIERWCGPLPWAALLSTPFEYVIMRDSMVPIEQLTATYARIASEFDEVKGEARYLGQPLEWLVEAPTPIASGGALDPGAASHTARTSERALDLPPFLDAIAARLCGHTAITVKLLRRVESIERTSYGFAVSGRSLAQDEEWEERSDIVVNCLWEDRRQFDAALGLPRGGAHLFRLKYRVIAQIPELPRAHSSCTMVLGRYGDVVVNPSGRHYLSWYPACMTESTTALAVPSRWKDAIAGPARGDCAQTIAARVVAGLARVMPAVRSARVEVVDAGVVCALGESDIDDPVSRLHRRSEVGVKAHDGYFSIDTGKLTCAPLFALHLAQTVEGA